MPKVTVLMPVYNVGPYVEESIKSVLNQTYTDFSILVIDDCSTDDTAARVLSIKDPRIRYEKNPHNLGLADNLNRGLSLIDTEYVARFDGDDLAEPDWLQTCMDVLESHPEIGICSSGFEWFGTRNGTVFYPEYHEDSMCQMLFGCTVIIPVFRKAVFDKNDIHYRTSAFPAEDYRVWADCYRVTRVYNNQKVLFHYRMHASQISTEKRQAQIVKKKEVQRVMLEWLNPNMAEDDIRFFIDTFIPGKMQTIDELPEWKAFVEKMIAYNTLGHFDGDALRCRLIKQVDSAAAAAVFDACFAKRFTLSGWVRWRKSGYASMYSRKKNMKLLIKSILMRKR